MGASQRDCDHGGGGAPAVKRQSGEQLHPPIADAMPAWAQGAALELVGHVGDRGFDVGPGNAGGDGGLRPGGMGEQLQVSRVTRC